MTKYITLLVLSLLLGETLSCSKIESERRKRTIPILVSPFHGTNNTPSLYEWKLGDSTRSFPFANIGPYPGNRWSLALTANPSGGEYVWYELDSLEHGEYEFEIYTRAFANKGDSLPSGRIVLVSADTSKEIHCRKDSSWHFVQFIDTLPKGKTRLYLYSGVAQDTGSKVLFNDVYVARIVER